MLKYPTAVRVILSLAIAPVIAPNLLASSATVTFGDEFCQTVRFPVAWRVFDRDKPIQQFEFRLRAGLPGNAATGEYLVAAVNPGVSTMGGSRKYSGNKYWVHLATGRVRPAWESEWNAGSPIPIGERFRAGLPQPKHAEDFVYWRTTFPKSGQKWPLSSPGVRISPNEQWIAVLSWQGEDYRDNVGISQGPVLGAPSRFFVDIYEVASGGRIVAIDGVDRDFTAGDAPLSDSFWLESSRFIVPLGSTRQKLLVCEIPAM